LFVAAPHHAMAPKKTAQKKDKKGKPIVEVKEPAPLQGRAFAAKFFQSDGLATEALALLTPQARHCDLGELNPLTVGMSMVNIGTRMKDEGSFPGGHYVVESSLEFDESIDCLRKSLDPVTCHEFHAFIQQAAKQAEAGYGTLSTWGPKLAALRWLCCIWWLASRVEIVNAVSVGACFGTIDPRASADACRKAKDDMFGWINELIHKAPLLKVYDFDLIGYGVYMNKRAEPMPRGGTNEWFRRQMQLDLAALCRQVKDLPPADLNRTEPRLHILRPYGTLTWMLPPPEALRFIVEKHDWYCQAEMPSIDEAPAKVVVEGLVMHMDTPPPVEFDFKDPEVIAKVQRGEDLGKGCQEDGLPGAIHGSIGLLFAGIMGVEQCVNAKLYPSLLEVDGFLECFMRYTTRLTTLDLSGCEGQMDEEFLEFLAYAGPSLRLLDLEKCGLESSHVDQLTETCEKLTGLQHLDLAYNELDAAAATSLITSLAEQRGALPLGVPLRGPRRVDLTSIRFDGCPVGDPHEFRQDIAGLLAARGDQVVAGGELVLYLGVDGVRWFAEPRPLTLAARRRDDTLIMAATSFEELLDGAYARNESLDNVF